MPKDSQMNYALPNSGNTLQEAGNNKHPISANMKGNLVSVVIPCYNQALFLPEAIETVLQQTYREFEVIVVDDGSTDTTVEVAQAYPIRYIYQENQGLPAARNTGIRASRGEFIVLLDSDDRLFPHALQAGLRTLEQNPDCLMATGDFAFVSANGTWMRPSLKPIIKDHHYQALLRCNFIEMTATCIFRRQAFDIVGLFDPTLRASEDYEFYLRLVRKCQIVCYGNIIAEYRSHGNSMSKDGERMLNETMRVMEAQRETVENDPSLRKAYREGIRFWRKLYGRHLAAQLAIQSKARREGYARRLRLLVREYPQGLVLLLARRFLSERFNEWLKERELRRAGWMPRDSVRFGDLRKVVPIGKLFNLDRGIPIHNFYCDLYLSSVARYIQGRILHVGERHEKGRGGTSVSSVLEKIGADDYESLLLEHVRGRELDAGQFDCIIVSDCLEYDPNPDIPLALLKRLLKPGGVLFAILPGLQSGHRQGGIGNVHWHFTTHSARNLFERFFSRDNTYTRGFGNILTTIAALHGLTAQELTPAELENHDPAYEVSIFVQAINS
jgi:glycosyltransferase involved in cell wall biosynthesis